MRRVSVVRVSQAEKPHEGGNEWINPPITEALNPNLTTVQPFTATIHRLSKLSGLKTMNENQEMKLSVFPKANHRKSISFGEQMTRKSHDDNISVIRVKRSSVNTTSVRDIPMPSLLKADGEMVKQKKY